MLLVRLTGGRLAEGFFRVGDGGFVRPCTRSHVVVSWGGARVVAAPLHLDVRLRVWSTGGHRNTILELGGTRMREDMTLEGVSRSRSYVLDPSGAPLDIEFQLWPIPRSAPLPYAVGDQVPFDLRTSRGWTKKVELRVKGGR